MFKWTWLEFDYFLKTGKEKRNSIILFSIVGIVFFLVNLVLIYKGHFHEDAYILFTYVENFSDGFGIAFYKGGPPTEGATDFLWLLILSFFGFIGLNTGLTVLLLNSFSVAIISYIFFQFFDTNKRSFLVGSFILFLSVFWIFSGPLKAGIGGFSVFPFMLLVVIILRKLYQRKVGFGFPWLLLILSLFRPDGLILAISFFLISIIISQNPWNNRKLLLHYVLCISIAAFYFLIRWRYFGNLLPLPLYVKSTSVGLPGLNANIDWIVNFSPLIVIVGILLVVKKEYRSNWILLVPGLIHFAILSKAEQIQNIGFRFQAPIFISFYFVLLILVSKIDLVTINKYLLKVILMIFLGLGVFFSANNLRGSAYSILRFNYINQFPKELNINLPENSKVAVTEAGRIPYWLRKGGHRIVDLVGLNSDFPAKNNISFSYLEQLDPDLLMFYNTGEIRRFFKTSSELLNNTQDPVIKIIEPFEIPQSMLGDRIEKHISKAVLASRVGFQFLVGSFSEYDIFLVDYAGDQTYRHTYAIKKGMNEITQLETLLINGFNSEKKRGYLEMIMEGK